MNICKSLTDKKCLTSFTSDPAISKSIASSAAPDPTSKLKYSDTLDANTAPRTYTADDTIDVLAQVAPGGGGTGDIEIWVTAS